MKMKGSVHYTVLASVFILGFLHVSVHGRPLLTSLATRPQPDDAAPFARWMVSESSWGVLNTISSEWGGAPFGNVASFSDGLPGKGKGLPYFYITALDPTVTDALKDQRASLTISEYNLGTCGKKDPENPSCARLTLVGKLKLVDGNPKDAEFAQIALFNKHPEMPTWPKDHSFQIFKLDIEYIFLVNWFGGRKPVTVDQYFHAEIDRNEFEKFTADTTSEQSSPNVFM